MAASLDPKGLYLSVGEALSAFHSVETGLAACFAFSCSTYGRNRDRAMSAFFAIEKFRSKLEVAHTSVRLLLRSEPELETWRNLHSRTEKASRIRNKLAHGATKMIHTKSGPKTVLAGHDRDVRWMLAGSTAQSPPSMGLTEIAEAKGRFLKIGEELHTLSHRIHQLAAQQ
jgi:hypothetical protein